MKKTLYVVMIWSVFLFYKIFIYTKCQNHTKVFKLNNFNKNIFKFYFCLIFTFHQVWPNICLIYK